MNPLCKDFAYVGTTRHDDQKVPDRFADHEPEDTATCPTLRAGISIANRKPDIAARLPRTYFPIGTWIEWKYGSNNISDAVCNLLFVTILLNFEEMKNEAAGAPNAYIDRVMVACSITGCDVILVSKAGRLVSLCTNEIDRSRCTDLSSDYSRKLEQNN